MTALLCCMSGFVFIGIPLWFVASLCWVARGESDVNGDPERDANGGGL